MKNIINGHYFLQLKNFVLDAKFSFTAKGITAIIGQSGCGKTTFFRCLSGLTVPDDGYLSLNNTCLQDSKKKIFAPTKERNIGFVLQDTYLFPHLNIENNLTYGYKRTDNHKFCPQEIIEMLELNKLLKCSPDTLSGGEKQRVAIARALLTSPSLLLLDEPANALDYKNKENVFRSIEKISSSLSLPILLITHEFNEIKHFVSQYLLMTAGKFSSIQDMA